MSKRGMDFLHHWIETHVPETAKADVISIEDISDTLIADAFAAGISRNEIFEEVHSLDRMILDAIVHFNPGLPE